MSHDVFIAWDHRPELGVDAIVYGGCKKATSAGVPTNALALDQRTQGITPDVVRRRVREARKGVMVLLDTANVNVCYELGLALGCGARVALGCTHAERPPWLLAWPPLRASFVRAELSKGSKLAEAVVALAGDGEIGDGWFQLRPAQEPEGTDTLLLCPGDGAGETFRDEALEVLVGAKVPPDQWSLADLPALVDGVRRVVLILPQPRRADRDDVQAAHLAVAAGYAHTPGRELVVVAERGERRWEDLILDTKDFAGVVEMRRVLEDLPPVAGSPEASDPIEAWRRWIRKHHADLVPFVDVEHVAKQRLHVAVCDTVALRVKDDRAEGRALPRHDGTLRQVIRATSTPGDGGRCGRWLIAAEPGAGKTTALKQVAQELVEDGEAVPVLLSLAELMEQGPAPDVLRFAEERSGATGLAEALCALRQTPGAVWLLLDGLDEVEPRRIGDACRLLKSFSEDEAWQGVGIVATTRRVVLERHDVEGGFAEATLSSLSPAQQREMLGKLAPRVTDALWSAVQGNAPLADLVKNPLMLTLFALTGAEALAAEEALAVDRAGLYRRAVKMLLRRGRGAADRGVEAPEQAEIVLAELSFRLQERGGEAWSRSVLVDELWKAWRADAEAGGDLAFALEKVWGNHEAFLDDVRDRSALLGPREGPGSKWRYVHRSLREYLAAVALKARGPEAVDAWVERWQVERRKLRSRRPADGPRPDPARYGEVFALLCGLEEDPSGHLERLRGVSEELFVRALTTVDGLPLTQVDGWMWSLPLRTAPGDGAWDGDDLELALRRCHGTGAALESVLWARVSPEASPLHLGLLWVALERLVGPVDRRAFFSAAGRELPEDTGARWVAVEGGRALLWPGEDEGVAAHPSRQWAALPVEEPFLLGSPEGVGYDDEHPRHSVTLTQPYHLGRTTVTRGAYARFDPDHDCRGGDDHPVTEVSWYASRAYAAWLADGGSLPTEAEWEHACRAGTTEAYVFGDDAKDLPHHGWFRNNSDGKVQPVAQFQPNPWGLFDLHGNVWEWCRDGLRTYGSVPVTDPEGPLDGVRVIRGGSAWNVAVRCRSAYRLAYEPWWAVVARGFRVRLPAPS